MQLALVVNIYVYINVVYCVGRLEIQIEIQKGRCTANTDSKIGKSFAIFKVDQ